MSSETDDILGRAIARIGGPLSGWVTKKLADDVGSEELRLSGSQDAVISWVSALLGGCDTPATHRDPATGVAVVQGIVGSGFADMNPAFVTVRVHVQDHDGACRISIHAVAKEGLIKQIAGQTAARRIAEDLARQFPML